MYAQTEERKDQKRVAAHPIAQNKNKEKSKSWLSDNRDASVFQRKIKKLINNNPQAADIVQLYAKSTFAHNTLSSRLIIQRVIDYEAVKSACEKLKIPFEGNKIIEVPDKVMANTKFKDYPEGYVVGLSEEEKKESLTSMQQGPGQEKEYTEATAKDLLSLLGGAAYNHKIGAVVITEKMANYQRNLLHELGHHKQNIVSGFNSDNTTVLLLEYHNVLCNENLFAGPKRVSYGVDQTFSWVTHWNKMKNNEEKNEFLNAKAKVLIQMEEQFYQSLLSSKNKKEKDLDVYGLTAQKLSKALTNVHENPDNGFYVVRALFNMIKQLTSEFS
ncbi:hypothetical protein [Mangrovibacter phragmitis]|uniref:hypothetical protein n=1 Tax=Mangrovibacter phragmitis TaxID=1691903 RepID=UPI00336A2F0C